MDTPIHLTANITVRSLSPVTSDSPIEIEVIQIGVVKTTNEVGPLDHLPCDPSNSCSVSSPVDVQSQVKDILDSADISEETIQKFKTLCKKFKGLFSQHSANVGHKS